MSMIFLVDGTPRGFEDRFAFYKNVGYEGVIHGIQIEKIWIN